MAEDRLEGTVYVEVTGATADQVWSLLDFCNFHRVTPDMESCTRVEGVDGEPGCKRYWVGKPRTFGDGGETVVLWAYERLVAIDPVGRSHKYEITETNMGLGGFIGEFKVTGDDSRCRVEWSFAVESLGMFTRDSLTQTLEENLRDIGKTIEAIVASGEA